MKFHQYFKSYKRKIEISALYRVKNGVNMLKKSPRNKYTIHIYIS